MFYVDKQHNLFPSPWSVHSFWREQHHVSTAYPVRYARGLFVISVCLYWYFILEWRAYFTGSTTSTKLGSGTTPGWLRGNWLKPKLTKCKRAIGTHTFKYTILQLFSRSDDNLVTNTYERHHQNGVLWWLNAVHNQWSRQLRITYMVCYL